VLLLILVPLVVAQTQEEATLCIQESNQGIGALKSANFSTVRVDDIYSEMNDIFIAQRALEASGTKPNYELIISRCESISEINQKAITVNDEIIAIQYRIDELASNGVVNDTLTAKYNLIKTEFSNERYETASILIGEIYVEISEAQAGITKVKALYEASRKTVSGFVEDNWREIIFSLIIIIISSLIIQNILRIYLLKRKKRHLALEKEIITSLIKSAQKKYFEHKDMSEGEYSIKVTKFKELIRDINRKVPEVEEELINRRKHMFNIFKLKRGKENNALTMKFDKKIEKAKSKKKKPKAHHWKLSKLFSFKKHKKKSK
jgi:hypothetical protein